MCQLAMYCKQTIVNSQGQRIDIRSFETKVISDDFALCTFGDWCKIRVSAVSIFQIGNIDTADTLL